ncbi:MAG: signal peptide peptidase SppA [Holophagaceae bacterium]|nr:signal peptide peptidase SppA [Holophagaceae bacterium]
MKTFLQSFLGSLLAVVLALAGFFAFFMILVASMGPKPPVVPSKAVLILNLNRDLLDGNSEDDPAVAIQKAIGGDLSQDTPLPMLIQALDKASDDPKISGLFITGNLRGGGAAALLELRQALLRFEKKKSVISYNQTWGRGELYLCSGLGKIIVNSFGAIDITAPSANLMFFSKAFDKYGIQVQVTKVGKYKSAVEPFIQDQMSAENREQVRAYLEEIWNGMVSEIANGRKLEPEYIQRLANTKGLMSAIEAKDTNIVDQLAYYDEVLDELKKLAGKDATSKDFPQISIETYAKIPTAPIKSRNRIAVVVAEGTIVDGEGGSGEIGGDSLARELRALRTNSNVKAVVLRVNSPGGSAMASDVILREVIALKKEKPLVVSMGNLAASGGYWISTYADYIFAEPGTLTGSIGVFGMFPNAKKLANNHGITFDSVQLTKIGNPSLFRPMNSEEQQRAQALVDYVYSQFLEKVSDGRKINNVNAVHEIAQGRVWTGRRAVDLKLVDELGGLDVAIAHAAKLAKIEDDYRVDKPKAPQSPMERFMKAFGGSEKRKLAKIGTFDATKNELMDVAQQLRSLNDPNGIYALAPIGISIK